MDIEQVKKFVSLFSVAFVLFIFIMITYSIFVMSHFARQKKEIEKGYAIEKITLTPALSPTPIFITP